MANINNTSLIKDPIKGNGLAASLDLLPGQTILHITFPFLLVVEKAALERVCSYCLLEANPRTVVLKRCSSCKVPRYCSTTCQKADWKAIHQKECPALKTLPDVPPTAVRGLIQILLRHQYGPKMDPRWATLESHVDDLRRSKDRWDEIMLQANAAINFSKSSSDKLEIALQLHSRMSCNAFRATLPDESPIGLCFEPMFAIVNHSCEPNAFVVFDGRSMILRALNHIKEGEQVFASYIDPTQDYSQRITELQMRYFFTCDCPKCSHRENAYQIFLKTKPSEARKIDLLCIPERLTATAVAKINILSKSSSELKTHIDNAKEYLNASKSSPDHQQRLRDLQKAISYSQHDLFATPPFHHIIYELYLCYLDSGNYFLALSTLLLYLLNCSVFNHPQSHHPARVTCLFTIAKLLKHLASLDPREIIEPIPENEDVIEVLKGTDFIDAFHATMILVRDEGIRCHGEGSRFLREVDRELVEVEEVQRLRGGIGAKLRVWQVGGVEGVKEVGFVFGKMRELAGWFERKFK